MGKIMFFCIPAHGHTNPTLGVVKELKSRGHEVVYYSYNSFKERIENAGARFVSCDEYDCEQKLSAKDGKKISTDLGFGIKVLVDTTLALDEKIAKDINEFNPDCIVADSMAIWGKLSAKKYNVPFVSSTTTFAFNKEAAKTMKQSLWQLVKMIFSMPKITKEIKRLKDKGYPINNVLDIIANDENTDTIVYTSKQFQPCADTFSDKFSFVGPLLREPKSEFEKKAEKLIYISMGTVNNDMPHLYKSCIEAFKNTDFQVVISVGDKVDISAFGNLPNSIQVYNEVDQIALLKKADVFVTHCGMNSVNEALYFGVPLVMYPSTSEQGSVANRVEELGAGVRLKNIDKLSILSAVKSALNNEKYKRCALEISRSFHGCRGAVEAAEKIEQVMDMFTK